MQGIPPPPQPCEAMPPKGRRRAALEAQLAVLREKLDEKLSVLKKAGVWPQPGSDPAVSATSGLQPLSKRWTGRAPTMPERAVVTIGDVTLLAAGLAGALISSNDVELARGFWYAGSRAVDAFANRFLLV